MTPLGRLRHRLSVFSHDLVMVVLAWMGAHWLRFNLDAVPEPILAQAWQGLFILLPVQAGLFWYFGLYRGVWRFASLPDLARIARAVVTGAALCAVLLFLYNRMADVPRSVFPLYVLLLISLLGGPRLLYRWFRDRRVYTRAGQRVLLVGAGRAGEMLVREMLREPSHPYDPVGFVDDDAGRHGREIHGVRVLGGCDAIPALVERHEAEVILLALPSASSGQMRRIVELCEGSGVPFRTLPPMDAVVSGRAALQELREVSVEDLLGRDPVSLDWRAIEAGLKGRTVLVSGGGGSIGAELCRQIARLGPAALVILEQSEFNLYRIEMELRHARPELTLHACLGDVADRVSVEHVMGRFRPEVVLHAAAYKHVPMLEAQVREAARNNILGTRILAEAADRHGCGIFVLISTDKAVNPANVMGGTKRCAEIFCQNLNGRSATRFITVRFGNVLGSAGSVVPLFRAQIEAGGPVTVTHPEITRYFMTIPEACQLILQAGVMGAGGEIYVLDMGEPVRIAYLAEQMIRLSGREPGRDIEIVYSGLRPGEKLYEELFHERERLAGTRHDKILLAHHRALDWSVLEALLDDLEDGCRRYDEAAVRRAVLGLVPELKAPGEGPMINVLPFDQRSRS